LKKGGKKGVKGPPHSGALNRIKKKTKTARGHDPKGKQGGILTRCSFSKRRPGKCRSMALRIREGGAPNPGRGGGGHYLPRGLKKKQKVGGIPNLARTGAQWPKQGSFVRGKGRVHSQERYPKRKTDQPKKKIQS